MDDHATPCPHCGYCPACGRAPAVTIQPNWYQPVPNWSPPAPWWEHPTITYSVANNTAGAVN